MFAAWSAVLLDEHIIYFEYRRGIIGWLLIGLIAGWLAGKIARGRGFGCITDIILGIVGSFIGGWVFLQIGIFCGGFLGPPSASTLGAVGFGSLSPLFHARRGRLATSLSPLSVL